MSVKPSLQEAEWLTRRKRIDPKLEAAGWRIVPFIPGQSLSFYERCAVKEFETANGPADYALCTDGKILGIVEAKKLTLGPHSVLTQAERYCKGITDSPFNYRGYRVPFLYSTNGEVIWHHDIRHELSRSHIVTQFHTPEALMERLQKDFDTSCRTLLQTPNDHPKLRPYQREANVAIEKAIADRRQQMLVAMSTGTGKTFTMVNEVYRLMKSGVAKRILFLVDRRALAAQAVLAFSSFEPEPGLKFTNIYELYSQRFQRGDFDEDQKYDPKLLPESYLINPNASHAFVYVSTIQRMTINLFGRYAIFGAGDEELDEDATKLDIPIHAFDLVIADECHRGYTSSEAAIWRKTLDHFDAVKVGLTATPAAHTTAYFKDIVYRYEYERAVREGFLVDYDVITVKSNVRMSGIFLKEGEQVGVVNPESGTQQLDLLEDERQFDSTQVEQDITAPDSNKKILKEVKKWAEEHEKQYGRFPKILIFAVNDLPHTSHADNLVEMGRDVFGRGDSFVQKITGRVDRPLQHIREFRNRPMPSVVVTVDLLTTGVDIPDLEGIVFLRPVKSRILFEQMLGRGTRKGEHFPDKSHFVVFDCFDGTLLEYFKNATAITAEPPLHETRTIAEIIEDIWNNRDRDYNIRRLVKRLQRIDKEMSGEAREMFAAYIPQGDMANYASDLPRKMRTDFTGTMKLLRDNAFQDLLVSYPRRQRTFWIAIEAEDTVTSSWLVRGTDGNPINIVEGRIVPNENVSISKDTFLHLQEYALRPGDILIARRGEMGRSAVVGSTEEGWLCGTGSAVLRLKETAIPHFMQMFISSPKGRAYLSEGSVGSTMENLNQKLFAAMPVSLPSTEEQKEIVRRVERLFELAQVIENRVVGASSRGDKLTQSILAKAFRGELVPTEAELARREGREYEPASVLLERIQQERANQARSSPASKRNVKKSRALVGA